MNHSIEHLALIMDGNQRWSKKNNQSLEKGYEAGLNKLNEIVAICIKNKIKYLTVYALSSENIKRPSVKLIYEIIRSYNKKIFDNLIKKNKVKIQIIGEKNNIPKDILKIFDKIKIDNNNYNLQLNIVFNYGVENEIQNIIESYNADNKLNSEINFELIKSYMYLGNIPNPDILIRTGGYQRLSNFILLNLGYTELFFTQTLWPDLKENEINLFFEKFSNIKRNYGL